MDSGIASGMRLKKAIQDPKHPKRILKPGIAKRKLEENKRRVRKIGVSQKTVKGVRRQQRKSVGIIGGWNGQRAS